MFLNRFNFRNNDLRFKKYNLIIFFTCLELYLLNIFYLSSLNTFFQFYFDDLLAIIVLLSFINGIYPLKLDNLWLIIIITIFASFFWEYINLFIKSNSVFDYFDILAYFVSMFIYLVLIYFIEGEFNLSF